MSFHAFGKQFLPLSVEHATITRTTNTPHITIEHHCCVVSNQQNKHKQ